MAAIAAAIGMIIILILYFQSINLRGYVLSLEKEIENLQRNKYKCEIQNLLNEVGINIEKLNSYNKIAIYGYGELGIKLKRIIVDKGKVVNFFIDRRNVSDEDVAVYKPDDELPSADVMIITAVYDYWDICPKYKKQGIDVISITDIIDYERYC